MRRLIATIILVIIGIALAGCDFNYHPGYHHGYGHGAVIITRPGPVHCEPSYPYARRGGSHSPGRHGRRY